MTHEIQDRRHRYGPRPHREPLRVVEVRSGSVCFDYHTTWDGARPTPAMTGEAVRTVLHPNGAV